MKNKTIGFIGGGRITRILLTGFKRANMPLDNVVVSDINPTLLDKLKTELPAITTVVNDNQQPVKQDLVFLALHPQMINDVLKACCASLRTNAILISLAPKLTIAKISDLLSGFSRIVRMIPNAPSIINCGYNPVVYSQAITETEKNELIGLFKLLGEYPEVTEEKLEAYAILTGMGPTYFWFQFNELKEIGQSFGLTEQEVKIGIEKMVTGAIKTLFELGLTPAEVMDLIPLRPLKDYEANIISRYHSQLESLYKKLI